MKVNSLFLIQERILSCIVNIYIGKYLHTILQITISVDLNITFNLITTTCSLFIEKL